MKIFCERLKELREDGHLTRKKVEKDLNFGNGTLGKWEREERIPSIEVLVSLAEYFGVTPNFLLGYSEN